MREAHRLGADDRHAAVTGDDAQQAQVIKQDLRFVLERLFVAKDLAGPGV